MSKEKINKNIPATIELLEILRQRDQVALKAGPEPIVETQSESSVPEKVKKSTDKKTPIVQRKRERKTKQRRIQARPIIGWALFTICSLIIYGSFSWANYRNSFITQNIRISGEKILTLKDYYQILNPLNELSIHEIRLDDVRLVLEANPFVKAARVSRQFPNTLQVEIVERNPIAMLNMDPILLIDNEAVVLPDNNNYSQEAQIPVMSGFNPARELYPPGQESFSVKVKEAISILKQLNIEYPGLYENLSEITLSKDDEYVLILAERPTRVILGKDRVWTKIYILMQFEQTLKGQRALTDYKSLDMRYNKQIIAREWT